MTVCSSSGAFTRIVTRVPGARGISARTPCRNAATLLPRLRRDSQPADAVIMSREGLNDLIAERRIQAGTNTDLAQTPLGLSDRSGAQHPDVSTVEAFKRTLLNAKSITFPGSTTRIWMTTKLFPQLGIAKELEGKITNTSVAAVANGDAKIAIQL